MRSAVSYVATATPVAGSGIGRVRSVSHAAISARAVYNERDTLKTSIHPLHGSLETAFNVPWRIRPPATQYRWAVATELGAATATQYQPTAEMPVTARKTE